MDILMLAASIGSKVELQVTGSDEKIAIKEVENLFKNYFDEGE